MPHTHTPPTPNGLVSRLIRPPLAGWCRWHSNGNEQAEEASKWAVAWPDSADMVFVPCCAFQRGGSISGGFLWHCPVAEGSGGGLGWAHPAIEGPSRSCETANGILQTLGTKNHGMATLPLHSPAAHSRDNRKGEPTGSLPTGASWDPSLLPARSLRHNSGRVVCQWDKVILVVLGRGTLSGPVSVDGRGDSSQRRQSPPEQPRFLIYYYSLGEPVETDHFLPLPRPPSFLQHVCAFLSPQRPCKQRHTDHHVSSLQSTDHWEQTPLISATAAVVSVVLAPSFSHTPPFVDNAPRCCPCSGPEGKK
jgi:hypothetical protein